MDNLILYNVLDYQSLLESLQTLFENFLVKEHVSAVTRKNYRSDLRHFFNWVIGTVKTRVSPQEETPRSFLGKLTSDDIESYKRNLTLERTPLATINRRLSTIRKFFNCALVSGVIDQNPAIVLRNIPIKEPKDTEAILGAFGAFLIDEGASKITVKNYVDDVRDFFEWFEIPHINIQHV